MIQRLVELGVGLVLWGVAVAEQAPREHVIEVDDELGYVRVPVAPDTVDELQEVWWSDGS